jgi:hypothetical protein
MTFHDFDTLFHDLWQRFAQCATLEACFPLVSTPMRLLDVSTCSPTSPNDFLIVNNDLKRLYWSKSALQLMQDCCVWLGDALTTFMCVFVEGGAFLPSLMSKYEELSVWWLANSSPTNLLLSLAFGALVVITLAPPMLHFND